MTPSGWDNSAPKCLQFSLVITASTSIPSAKGFISEAFVSKPRPSPDQVFSIVIPPEQRWENRVIHQHSRSQWMARRDEFNNRCAYCGIRQDKTISKRLYREHVNPISRGGTDHLSNVVPACWICNGRKGRNRPGELSIDGRPIPHPRIRKRHHPW
jgi:hypothetical protein